MICALIGHKIQTMTENGEHQTCLRCRKILDWRTGQWLRPEDHPYWIHRKREKQGKGEGVKG